MTVSLLEIFAAARAHAAPLAAESAGYLLLAVADGVLLAPRVVDARDVELSPDGTVRLAARRSAASGAGAEAATRQLLRRALALASSVGPALRRAAERSDEVGLGGLVRELESALIPVNRAAAKRALSRLYRETARARDAGRLALEPDSAGTPEPPTPLRAAAPVAASLSSAPAPVGVAPIAAPPAPAPVVAAPVAAPSVVAAPVAVPLASPQTMVPEAVNAFEAALFEVEFEELQSPLPPPPVMAAPLVAAAPPPTIDELTPEPLIATAEPVLTKPEPVIARARERGNTTPRFGTWVTLQTLEGDEGERTEQAPPVSPETELPPTAVLSEPAPRVSVAAAEALTPAPVLASAAFTPSPALAAASVTPGATLEVREAQLPPAAIELIHAVDEQPLVDPEPSCLPDVVSAMVALHTGVEADEAPTRLRDVVTSVRGAAQASVTPARADVEGGLLSANPAVAAHPFISELAEPAVHEAQTWDPGPVELGANQAAAPPPAEAPEPSPYAPAVLPARTSDVSELLDSFFVSEATEPAALRSALKGMAGLELTPMPHPYVEER